MAYIWYWRFSESNKPFESIRPVSKLVPDVLLFPKFRSSTRRVASDSPLGSGRQNIVISCSIISYILFSCFPINKLILSPL